MSDRRSFTAETIDQSVLAADPLGAQDTISPSHQDYLIRRHGTIHLDPMPSSDPADPYNWPVRKKFINLLLVAFHAFMAVFISSGIIPAFGALSRDLDASLQKISYLIAMQILVLGFAPFFWRPISKRYGRRQVWLLSTIMSAFFNLCCAWSTSYNILAFSRCLVSFFISPALTLGSGVVVETFFKSSRGKCMGVWTALVTLGVPSGPLCMGFVADHLHYSWIFRIYAMINFVQFILYLFFGPETLYTRSMMPILDNTSAKSAISSQYLSFGRLDPSPLTRAEFIQPFTLYRYPAILISAISYSLVFGFCSVFLTVEIPHIMIPRFHFGPRELGYQFIGLIIGTVFGEQLAGPLSDRFIHAQTARLGHPPRPEYRLRLSYIGFIPAIFGLAVFCVSIDASATPGTEAAQWSFTPLLGSALAAFGNQVVTTVLTTYAIDCYPQHSASIGTFINVVRQTWGFLGPFWFPQMIDGLGLSGSALVMAVVIGAGSIVPVALLQRRGMSSFFSRSPGCCLHMFRQQLMYSTIEDTAKLRITETSLNRSTYTGSSSAEYSTVSVAESSSFELSHRTEHFDDSDDEAHKDLVVGSDNRRGNVV